MDKNPPRKVYQNRRKMALSQNLPRINFKPQRHSSTFEPAESTETDTVPPAKIRPTAATRRPVWTLKDTTKTGIYDGKPQFVKRRHMNHSPPKEELKKHVPRQEEDTNQAEIKTKKAGPVYLLGLHEEEEVCQIQPGDEDFFPGFLAAVESSFRDIQLECPQFQIDIRTSIQKKLELYSKHKPPDGHTKGPHILSDSEESMANPNPNKQLHWTELHVQGRGGLPHQSNGSDHSSGNSNWPNHLSRPPYRPAHGRGADHRHLGVISKPNPSAEFKLPFNLYKECSAKPPFVDSAHHQARKRVGEPLGPSRTADWMNQPIPPCKPPDHPLYSYPSATHRGVYRTDSVCSSTSSDSRRAYASNSAGCEPFPSVVNAGSHFGNVSNGPYRPTREKGPAYRIDSLASREIYGGEAADAYQLVSPVPTDSYDAGPYFRPLYSELNFP